MSREQKNSHLGWPDRILHLYIPYMTFTILVCPSPMISLGSGTQRQPDTTNNTDTSSWKVSRVSKILIMLSTVIHQDVDKFWSFLRIHMCVWFLLSQLNRAHPQTNLGNAICRQKHFIFIRYTSVHLLSRVRLFVTPWTVARQASLSITSSQSLPKLMFIELVMPSNHLILCHPLLLRLQSFPASGLFQI